jgi:Zinc carboxypeptidase.
MYGYDELLSDISKIDVKTEVIGKSLFGRDIIAVFTGSGKPRALIHGGIHSRENITSKLCIWQIIRHLDINLCYVPMVNPDGVELCRGGVQTAPENYRSFLLSVNGGDDFSLWKANGRAVDINVNFNAAWGTGAQNLKVPARESYIGEYSESEPETKALVSLTERFCFSASISYHTKGEVVYHGFLGNYPYLSEAEKLARIAGYPLLSSGGSAGGYKDWFVLQGYGLGLTFEVGDDSLPHPLGDEAFFKLLRENFDIPIALADVARRIDDNRNGYLNAVKTSFSDTKYRL